MARALMRGMLDRTREADPKAKDHGPIIASCIATRSDASCPLWVISDIAGALPTVRFTTESGPRTLISTRPSVQSVKRREIPILLLCAGDNLAGNWNLGSCTVYAHSGADRKAVCAKCGARGRHIDVRPNWKEQPAHESLTGKKWR